MRVDQALFWSGRRAGLAMTSHFGTTSHSRLFPSKIINKIIWPTIQRLAFLVFNHFSHSFLNGVSSLLDMENKGYSGTLGSVLMRGNGNFTGFLDASNSVAVNSIESR